MLKSFTYMFKDNKFFHKVSIYFFFLLIGNLGLNYIYITKDYSAIALTGLLVSGFFMLLANGYMLSCIKALNEQKDNYVLPFFNFKNNFIYGFKYFISTLLLVLFGGILYIVCFCAAKIIHPLLGIVIQLLLPITILIFSLSFNYMLAIKGWWTSFIKWGNDIDLIKNSGKTYWIAVGLAALVILIPHLITELGIPSVCSYLRYPTAAVIVGESLFASIFAAYTVYIWAYLCAKAINTEI